MKRRGWWRLALIGSGITAVIAWMIRTPAVPVDTAEVVRGPVTVVVVEEGMTRVRDRYIVAAPISGRLERPLIEAGDSVSQGSPVALMGAPPLDPRVRAEAEAHYQAAIDAERTTRAAAAQATDAVGQAAREEKRIETLHRTGVVAQEEWERTVLLTTGRRREAEAAASRAAAAAHDVEQARAAKVSAGSGRIVLRAPVTGRVLKVAEPDERVVVAGTAVAEIGDPGRLEVAVDLLSTDVVRIVPGDTMRVTGWGAPDTLIAVVRRIAPSGFTRISALGVEEQRVSVVGDLTTPGARLGDRFRVDVAITVGRVADAIRIPRSALFRERGRWQIFVMVNGRAKARTVATGLTGGEAVEIRSGTTVGERVILHPDERITDGQRVARRPER